MTLEKAIEIVKENCYIFNPLNFDRTILVNSALDTIIDTAKEKALNDNIKRNIGGDEN